MDIEEAKAMEGVEFIYEYSDGDTVPAFVKKFDPEVGLSCLSLATETTRDGWTADEVEEDGTWCVIGVQLKFSEYHSNHTMATALAVLAVIKEMGRYTAGTVGSSRRGPSIKCPFS